MKLKKIARVIIAKKVEKCYTSGEGVDPVKERYRISGMSCAACSARVQKVTEKLEGVTVANVNLLAGTLDIEYDEKRLSGEQIVAAVIGAGYGAEKMQVGAPGKNRAQDAAMKKMRLRLWISFPLLLVLMYFTMGHMVGLPLPSFLQGAENALYLALVQLALTLPVILVNGAYYIKGYRNLFKGAPNMDTLIAVGSGAAFIYGLVITVQMAAALHKGDTATAGELLETT